MWRILLLALALAGCASTPEATPERDAQAKRFESRADAATIYAYRDDIASADENSQGPVLYVDDRLIGATLPATYFRFDVRAGAHLLRAVTHDESRLKLDARSGEVYYVRLQTAGGSSTLRLVKPEVGKSDILRCCTLLENWETGQRPFLR
jgi:hypothetical protein